MDPTELYEHIFRYPYRVVEITLISGENFRGIVNGFYKEPLTGEINRWHLVAENESGTLGRDVNGSFLGIIVVHENIICVHFPDHHETFFLK